VSKRQSFKLSSWYWACAYRWIKQKFVNKTKKNNAEQLSNLYQPVHRTLHKQREQANSRPENMRTLYQRTIEWNNNTNRLEWLLCCRRARPRLSKEKKVHQVLSDALFITLLEEG
jgi:hypothetical protein